MKQKMTPLEFLKKVNKDTDLGVKVYKAMEKGNMTMAKEVLAIAKEAGFVFSREEFESEIRKDIEKRFAAGDVSVASAVSKKIVSEALESSCAKGCLSYTTSYHPSRKVLDLMGKPVIK